MLSGQPAFLKHEATCTAQLDHDFLQLGTSSQSGSGLEHQLPHLYSHGGGTTFVVTQTELLVVVLGTCEVLVLGRGVVEGTDEDGGQDEDDDVGMVDADEVVLLVLGRVVVKGTDEDGGEDEDDDVKMVDVDEVVLLDTGGGL